MFNFLPRSEELQELAKSLRPLLIPVAVFSGVCNILMLVPSLYMMQVYDRVLASYSVPTLVMLSLIVLVLYAVLGGLEWVRSRLLIDVGDRFDAGLANRVFTAAYERNLRQGKGHPGAAMQDVASVRQFIAGPGVMTAMDIPWVPIYVAVLFLMHFWLGAMVLVMGAVLLGLAWLSDRLTSDKLMEANTHALAANLYAGSNLRQTDVIESMGMLERIRKLWRIKHSEYIREQTGASEYATAVGAVSKVVRILAQSMALGLGAYLVLQGELSAGAMIAASILVGRAMAPMEQGIGVWRQSINARQSLVRIAKLLNEHPEREQATALPAPEGELRLENVYVLAPGGTEPVLKDLSFSFKPGDAIAVVGPSAAGKSTLARAVLGVWPAAKGHVRWGGADVGRWPKHELGQYVGYLPQAVELFEGTVAENIGRFHAIDSAKVVAAAQAALAHELILRLPQGYDTPIGADGALLSAGQRQRIGLARALYGEPRLVVLDEPNANLDEAGEAALSKVIVNLRERNVIVVVVTHRTALLQSVNKMLVLREGRLHLYGPKDKVMDELKKGSSTPARLENQA